MNRIIVSCIIMVFSLGVFASDTLQKGVKFELSYQYGMLEHGAIDNGTIYSGTYYYSNIYGGTYPTFYFLKDTRSFIQQLNFGVKKRVSPKIELVTGVSWFKYSISSVIQNPFEIDFDSVSNVIATHYDTRFECDYKGIRIPLVLNYEIIQKGKWSVFTSLGGCYHRIMRRVRMEYDVLSDQYLETEKDGMSKFPASANWYVTGGLGSRWRLNDRFALIGKLSYDHRVTYKGWNRVLRSYGMSVGVEF